ncbi:MAG: histidinol-phosphate transaminase [Pseudomonadota bacterium]
MQVSPEIESLIPYKPGKPIEETKRELGLEEVIKLASNENPLGASPMAVEAIQKACTDLNRYPDPSCFRLRKKLAEKWRLRSDDIVIGNGSNELIDLLIRVFCEPGDAIITPQKSFVAYGVCSQAARVSKKEITVRKDFSWSVEKFIDDFKKDHNSREKILFIANPNNPTGHYLKKEEMDLLISELGGRKDILVVIDEAYNEYVRADDFPLTSEYIRDHRNVMVIRTFSKIFGLAGLRVGALIGHSEYTQWINRVRNPFNVNTLAQEAAIAAMDDHDYIKRSQEVVWQGLDDFYAFLDELKIPYLPSQTNFVLFDSLRDGQLFFTNAMRKGLLVRPMTGYQLPRHVRLSVGTSEENKKAMEILRQTFAQVPEL